MRKIENMQPKSKLDCDTLLLQYKTSSQLLLASSGQLLVLSKASRHLLPLREQLLDRESFLWLHGNWPVSMYVLLRPHRLARLFVHLERNPADIRDVTESIEREYLCNSQSSEECKVGTVLRPSSSIGMF